MRDEGGELRARDLHRVNKGYFGILSRKDGMPLDMAREIAVEDGYLHPDSDINDLLDAIDRTMHGQPVFSDRDATQVAEWKLYERARRGGEFEGEPPLPGEPANFDAAAAARYRAAAEATRARAQAFNGNPVVGPALAERGGMYRIAESRLPERFLSSPEGVQAFLAGGGDRDTLRDALVADLRRSATNAEGALDPLKYRAWQARRAAALRAFPELQDSLGNAAQAQQAVDAATAAARAATLAFERGAARHFLRAEPVQAVGAALASRNPVAEMRALAAMVAGDPDAKAGLQRAVADYIARRFVRNPDEAGVGPMNAAAFGEFVRRTAALREVLAPEQVGALNRLAADLRRAATPLPKAGGGGAVSSFLRALLQSVPGAHGAAGAAGLAGFVHGGFIGGVASAVLTEAAAALRRAGIERTDQLLAEAMLNPELARTLLMKATPANRPLIARRLAGQLGTLAAASALPPPAPRGRN